MALAFHSDRVLVNDAIFRNFENGIVHHVHSWNQMIINGLEWLIAAFELRILEVDTTIVNAVTTGSIAWIKHLLRSMEWIRVRVISAKKVELMFSPIIFGIICIPWIDSSDNFTGKWLVKFSCLDKIKFYCFVITKCFWQENWLLNSLALFLLWVHTI